ncbi:MAG: hypothetical protein JWM07_19 [Candidatus Saccharibacteria bacterium]|nr:hypothetical protein [Candidatus Saccharibacteria bacterium]
MSILTYVAEAAQKIDPSLIGINDPVKNSDTAMLNILNTVYLWAGIVCVIVIIIAGFIYVTSNGNAANIKKGKDAIMGAVIGLVVVIMAFTITQFVLGRFQ